MKPLKQKGKNGGREPSRDLRGEMSKDRIITVSLILYWDLKMFCTLVEGYGNLGVSSKCDSYKAFNTVLTSLTFSNFFFLYSQTFHCQSVYQWWDFTMNLSAVYIVTPVGVDK